MIDEIAEAEEQAARARALKEDFPGSRNVPSTGLNFPGPESSTLTQKSSDERGDTRSSDEK
ncbi:hypothetical protein FRC15_006077 [Serendipita sp. 397]|nr:hypothetical protein FRC15_006077 [Serendipita sp. 397]KAG8803209.1 hypothetical protein FRC16_006680 [Serendipita sp. 398]